MQVYVPPSPTTNRTQRKAPASADDGSSRSGGSGGGSTRRGASTNRSGDSMQKGFSFRSFLGGGTTSRSSSPKTQRKTERSPKGPHQPLKAPPSPLAAIGEVVGDDDGPQESARKPSKSGGMLARASSFGRKSERKSPGDSSPMRRPSMFARFTSPNRASRDRKGSLSSEAHV